MDVKLAAAVVHDIKNALGVLEGELYGLTLEPTREHALQAHQQCAALRDKLIGFLTMYKAESQGLSPRVEDVNPEDFLRALLNARPSARPDLRITINTQGLPALGFFDENLVGLALEAALQNATRFARAAIDIGCAKADDGDLVFTVRDDGPGLGTAEDKPSTGLGMELCGAIAQAHRRGNKSGSVALCNHPAGGAVFTLRLP